MTAREDGGPAFPIAEVFDERRGEVVQYASPGMSLRDYFAGEALSGLVVEGEIIDPDKCAALCYELADAMLKARTA